MRLFTSQEIDALAICSGFKCVAMYGALQNGISIDDEKLAFRLVAVLQKDSTWLLPYLIVVQKTIPSPENIPINFAFRSKAT